MAANKTITAKGKTKLLQYVFGKEPGFSHLALGIGGNDGASNAAATGDENDFREITAGDNGYRRAKLIAAEDTASDAQSITLSATFDDDNYSPSGGGYIGEIGIVDREEPNPDFDTFFAFADIPDILKSDNISLKYTIVISIL